MDNIYNADFECEYRIKEDETQYRKEFLQVFNLTAYEENKIINSQSVITETLCKIPEFNNLFLKASSKASQIMMAVNMDGDPEFGLLILFSYDYFDFFHDCVKEFFKCEQKVTQSVNIKINNLLKKLSE